MKAQARLLGTLATALLISACGDAPAPGETPADDAGPEAVTDIPAWVDELADVARAIEAAPASADSILATAEMTRARFDSLIYEVAADPALTTAFEAARR